MMANELVALLRLHPCCYMPVSVPCLFRSVSHILVILLNNAKTCLRRFANNKGVDQPTHPRSLISAFVIRLLESIITRLATSKNSIFYLVSVVKKTDFCLALSETPKIGFVTTSPLLCCSLCLV